MDMPIIYLLFLFAITLHNIEEALWLPRWSKCAENFYKNVEPDAFRFAVLIITLLAYLTTGLYLFFPGSIIFKYLYFGFLGAMILNAVIPHFIATVIIKKYCPGLITALFLIIPFNTLIIAFAVQSKVIRLGEVIGTTFGVAILLLGLIPLLQKAGKKIINY